MKKHGIYATVLLILWTGFLFTSCSAHKGAMLPEKLPAPPEKAPELGAPPSTRLPAYPSQGIVQALTAKARRQMANDESDRAFSTLEQALKIDPSDPVVWHMLAGIQLKRGNLDQAEQLARKSNLFARNHKTLRNKNWTIIAEALERKGHSKEARAARQRAKK